MQYFIDTEFLEAPGTIELISLGIVMSTGQEYYAQSYEFDANQANLWVAEHVLPHLAPCPAQHTKLWHVTHDCTAGLCVWKSKDAIRADVIALIGDQVPEFWGYYCAYDWVVFCWLFGAMVNLPEGWPMFCYDLRQWLNHRELSHITQPDDMPHHALSDARWIAETYKQYAR